MCFQLHRWLHSGETVICTIFFLHGKTNKLLKTGIKECERDSQTCGIIRGDPLHDTDCQCTYQVVSGASCRQRNVGYAVIEKVLTTKLLNQGYQKTKLVDTLKKFCGRHHDIANPYSVAVSRILSDVFANDEP